MVIKHVATRQVISSLHKVKTGGLYMIYRVTELLKIHAKFSGVATSHGYQTRGNKASYCPYRLYTISGSKCFSARGPLLWTALPVSIREEKHLVSFKNKLLAFVESRRNFNKLYGNCFSNTTSLWPILISVIIFSLIWKASRWEKTLTKHSQTPASLFLAKAKNKLAGVCEYFFLNHSFPSFQCVFYLLFFRFLLFFLFFFISFV